MLHFVIYLDHDCVKVSVVSIHVSRISVTFKSYICDSFFMISHFQFITLNVGSKLFLGFVCYEARFCGKIGKGAVLSTVFTGFLRVQQVPYKDGTWRLLPLYLNPFAGFNLFLHLQALRLTVGKAQKFTNMIESIKVFNFIFQVFQ